MMKPLGELEMPWKLLATFFLIVLTSGFIVAELYLMHTTEMVDGKPGMSMNDIVYQFHGNRNTNTLRRNVEGGMKKYFAETENEKDLTKEDLDDIAAVVAWSMDPKEETYWDPKEKAKDKNPKAIYNVMERNGCFSCHTPEPEMGSKGKKDSPLDTFAFATKFTKIDQGMDKGRLLSLSHIHLLGMGMMFLLAGAAIASTRWPAWMRSALIVGGLSSILLDIFGWWGVKWYGAPLAPVVMAGGILMTLSFTGSVFFSMYDMWIIGRSTPPPKPVQSPVIVNT